MKKFLSLFLACAFVFCCASAFAESSSPGSIIPMNTKTSSNASTLNFKDFLKAYPEEAKAIAAQVNTVFENIIVYGAKATFGADVIKAAFGSADADVSVDDIQPLILTSYDGGDVSMEISSGEVEYVDGTEVVVMVGITNAQGKIEWTAVSATVKNRKVQVVFEEQLMTKMFESQKYAAPIIALTSAN